MLGIIIKHTVSRSSKIKPLNIDIAILFALIIFLVFGLLYAPFATASRYSNQTFFIAPPGISENNELYKLGLLDVTLYPGVDKTGTRDSTAGLQKALDDAYDYQLTAFFPSGTYLVSDTLKSIKKRLYAKAHSTVLIGSTQGQRPLIKLMNRSRGFDNPSNPKSVIEIYTAGSEAQSAPWGTPATDPIFDQAERQQKNSFGFRQFFRGIDIDVGDGNPGAVGLYFPAAQDSAIHDVQIDATGGFAGIWNIPTRSSGGAANIVINGGRYGLYLSSGAGATVVGAKLHGQTEAAIYNSMHVPMTYVGVDIVKAQAPAIITPARSATASSTYSLIDSKIVLTNNSNNYVIDNREADKNIYLRNVYINGTDNLIISGNKAVTGHGQWKRIAEYTNVDPKPQAAASSAKNNGDITQFASYTMIDGMITKNNVVHVEDNATAPAEDLISRHMPPPYPSFEDADAVNIFNFNIAGNDEIADGAALQTVINTNKKVFIPKGNFLLEHAIHLHSDTILFGLGNHASKLYTHESWKPTEETTIIKTANDAEATTYLGFLYIGYAMNELEYDWFNSIHWRAGRNSAVVSVFSMQSGWRLLKDTNPHNLYKITDNGGGRWYFSGSHSKGTNRHPDYRYLLVEGTSEPLSFYGLNLEKARSNTMAEFRNARNIRVYNTKIEGNAPVITITGQSNNIAAYGQGKATSPTSMENSGIYQVKDASRNILFANMNNWSYNVNETRVTYTVLEEFTPGAIHGVRQPNNVSLYKLGEIDDSLMHRGMLNNLNEAPVAEDDQAFTRQDEDIIIDVLSNDYDRDGVIVSATLDIQQTPNNGSVNITSDGKVRYVPDQGFYGIDRFAYSVEDNDGARSNEANVFIAVNQTEEIIRGDNSLLNAGFEQGDKSHWAGGGTVINSDKAFAGNYVLRMSGHTERWLAATQTFPATSGDTYRFGGRLHVENNSIGKYRLQIRWYRDSGTEVSGSSRCSTRAYANTSNYVDISAECTAPQGAVTGQLHLKANRANGTAYFDELYVEDINGTDNEIIEPDSLLENPGFENGEKTPWRGSGHVVSNDNARSGNAALRMAGNPEGWLAAHQSFPVSEGQTYQFGGWMKVVRNSTGKFRFQIRWYGESGSEVSGRLRCSTDAVGNTSYVEKYGECTAPAGAVTAQIHLKANKADGIAYFDDIHVTKQ